MTSLVSGVGGATVEVTGHDRCVVVSPGSMAVPAPYLRIPRHRRPNVRRGCSVREGKTIDYIIIIYCFNHSNAVMYSNAYIEIGIWRVSTNRCSVKFGKSFYRWYILRVSHQITVRNVVGHPSTEIKMFMIELKVLDF